MPAKGQYEKEPSVCPLCNNSKKGFYEEEREDRNDPEEERTSKEMQKALEELESYEEGCDPKDVKYNCEC